MNRDTERGRQARQGDIRSLFCRTLRQTLRQALRRILRWVALLLFGVRVTGAGVPVGTERLVVIANHESFLDGLLLGLFLPLDPVFIVHTEVVRVWYFRMILSLVDYLAVDPSRPLALKQAIRRVESGRPVVVFPEGRITVTGSLMKVYDGPAFMVARTGATVLPVRLDGPARSYFSRLAGRYPRRLLPRITLTLLPATTLPRSEAPTARLRRRKAGEAMRRLMQEMAFASRPRQTLYSALMDAVGTFGRSRGLLEDLKQVEYTYGDLLKMTLVLGRLVERHTARDETVGVLLPNSAPTLALVFGLGARGRVPAMLNYTAGAEGIQAACVAGGIRTLIASRAFLEPARLTEKVASLKDVRVLILEDLRQEFGLADKLWLLCIGLRFPRAFEASRDPESPAVVLFTSGTEGKPKGVVLSHRALLANVAQIRAVIDISVEDKLLNAMPVFHSFGLTAGALLPVLTGASLFLYPSPLHYRIIPELTYDRNCTILFGTNSFLAQYAKYAHPYDFFRLRYVIAGAEKLSGPVRDLWFEKFGLRILEGYGATETAPVLAVNTPMAFRAGAVGQLLPGVEARLAPVPGIQDGGLLHVRGPNLMSGYLRVENPGRLEPPASEFGPGWYATGDIVDIDEDGFLRILGRVKRFAKIAGEMVSLEAVEKLAAAASPQAVHAVASKPDPQRGEALVLFTTDAGLARERLQTAAREGGWPELAVPRRIQYVNALPLLGTGKIDYVTLKTWAEAS